MNENVTRAEKILVEHALATIDEALKLTKEILEYLRQEDAPHPDETKAP